MLEENKELKKRLLRVKQEKDPKPGNFFLAQIDSSSESIIRRYKQLSVSKRHLNLSYWL
ncbi:protein of unknown function [Legionella pneumophila subsp. pneumophila]|nr:protein of unknown function [Legionella pneumophila subsp. pneumophila]